MEENISKKNIGFFERLKKAIFKLEEYGSFLGERLSVAFKYFFLLVLLTSCIISMFQTYDFSRMVKKFYSYVENELPEFEYNDGIAKSEVVINAFDEDYGFRFIVNTEEDISEEIIQKYKNEIYDNKYGIIVLNDSLICISNSSEIKEKYIDIEKEYSFNIHNREDFVETINKLGKEQLIAIYFIIQLIILFIVNCISILGDVCIVAIFGWIAGRICGLKFKMAPMIGLAIYSLSLSIVLSTIYNCSYILTSFYIQYFNVIYLLIAYVYIIAAIFMIKYDLIKQTQEVQKIVEVQKQVKEDIKNSKEDKEDSKDNEKEEDKQDESAKEENKVEENKEPDGSEI